MPIQGTDKGYEGTDPFDLGVDPADVRTQPHYTNLGVEPITVMRKNFTFHEFIGYLRGNVIKYILRCQEKPMAEQIRDLQKAQVYLGWLVDVTADKEREIEQLRADVAPVMAQTFGPVGGGSSG